MNEQLLALIREAVTDATMQAAVIQKIQAKNFVIRTADEEATFKTNFINQEKDNILKDEKKKWMQRVEDDIRDATGLRQNSSEPYHEYMKRALGELKEKVTTLSQANKDLEAGKGSDSVWKTKYETLEAQSKTALEIKDKELLTLKGVTATQERKVMLQEIFAPIEAKFMSELPPYFAEYKKNVINDLLNHSEIIDGKLVMVDDKKNPMKDNSLNNVTLDSVLSEKFKDVIKTDKEQAGAGGAAGGKAPADAGKGSKFEAKNTPKDIDSEAKLNEYLGKQGLLQNSKEYDEAFAAAKTQNNITKIF
jgi:hypothetical protein